MKRIVPWTMALVGLAFMLQSLAYYLESRAHANTKIVHEDTIQILNSEIARKEERIRELTEPAFYMVDFSPEAKPVEIADLSASLGKHPGMRPARWVD